MGGEDDFLVKQTGMGAVVMKRRSRKCKQPAGVMVMCGQKIQNDWKNFCGRLVDQVQILPKNFTLRLGRE